MGELPDETINVNRSDTGLSRKDELEIVGWDFWWGVQDERIYVGFTNLNPDGLGTSTYVRRTDANTATAVIQALDAAGQGNAFWNPTTGQIQVRKRFQHNPETKLGTTSPDG